MKTATIKSVLEEKRKELLKYLARCEKDQKDMRKERHLAYATDVLEGLSHQIGYMNGAIENISQMLEMMEVTDKQFFDRRKEVDEHNKRTMDQLRSIIRKKK